MEAAVTKVTGGKWVRTRKCGCGECQSRPGVCPDENAIGSRWLWGTEYSGDDMPVTELDDEW